MLIYRTDALQTTYNTREYPFICMLENNNYVGKTSYSKST